VVRLKLRSTYVFVIGSKSKLSYEALRFESKFETLTTIVTLIMLARITDKLGTSRCAVIGMGR
jgi:hypothetical protein